jgi:uroporphyrinogen III methyltransferase/synthase
MAKGKKGKVYIVGAGPGDPGLLTVKGRECLSQADVVIYDNLANRVLLKCASREAELIYVGKKGGCHVMSQEKINELIIDRASKDQIVVRLKGGDPFVFGRGGEEVQELSKAGVDFEVVSGVTSATAVPAYAGIPLTHRDYTSTVAFVTGHEDPTKAESDIAWDRLATGAGTLVFLMGVGNLPRIVERLLTHGRSPDSPAAVIQKGTLPEQRTLVGPLCDIPRMAEESNLKPPAVIVVGDVVNLRSELNWFETAPLFGKRIVVTRAREQASEFLGNLVRLGAECIEFPTIELAPPESWEPLDKAIHALPSYQWLLFTSANGVKQFCDRLRVLEKDIRELKGIMIGAIGPKTAEAWQNFGIQPDLVPSEYRAEAIVEGLRNRNVKGQRILLPRAAKARRILPDELRKMGAHVDVVPVYKTILPDQDTSKVRKMLIDSAIAMVTFTSSSTVTNFAKMFQAEERKLQEWMDKTAVACIGPVTAGTARDRGFSVALIAPQYTIASLTESIVEYFTKK